MTETYLILFALAYILFLLYAIVRWPEFFKGNSDDPPIFPPH